MKIICCLGLHHWSFSNYLVDDPANVRHTEYVRARCVRQGCTRYGAWSLVHMKTRANGKVGLDTPVTIA